MLRDLELGTSVCAVIGADRDLIHPDAAIRDNGMAYLRTAINVAAELGPTSVAGPLYSAVGRCWQMTADERARDIDLLVQQLRTLAEYAGDRGVVLCIEPINRFETSFINLAEQAIEVIDRVDHPACQIMLDTFHMNIEESSLGAAIRAVGPRLKHFHACENDRGTPGSGHVPWQDVADGLKAIGYDGPVVIESFTADVKTIARAARSGAAGGHSGRSCPRRSGIPEASAQGPPVDIRFLTHISGTKDGETNSLLFCARHSGVLQNQRDVSNPLPGLWKRHSKS